MEHDRKNKIIRVIKWALLMSGCLIAIVVIPLIINECYKDGGKYVTLWDAKDVLAYYGTIISAIGAGIGVFISIQYSHKQYSENIRLSNMPFFSVNVLKREFEDASDHTISAGNKDKVRISVNGSVYQESKRNEAYFFVEDDEIKYSATLEKKKKEIICNGGFAYARKTSGVVYEHCVTYLPHEIQNVGAGCAINLVVAMMKFKSEWKAISFPTSLSVGEKMYVGIYIRAEDGVEGKYDFKISYYDILGNRYVQDVIIEVAKSKIGYSVTEQKTIIQRRVDGEAVIVC